MEKNIIISPELDKEWKERIDEQLRFKLGSVDARLNQLTVSLIAHKSMTECRVEAATGDGDHISYSINNPDPEVGIADAVARLRREAARRHRLARVG